MKIRIDNQIFETDENTLCDWIRLGRIPEDAELSCETLTNGKWIKLHELDLGVDEDPKLLEEKLEEAEEKRGYPRKFPKVTLALIAVNTIVFILLDQGSGHSKNAQILTQFGAYSYPLIVEVGEYWRLITNTFLHVGLLHFCLNMGAILGLGYRVEGLFGRWRFLIIYLVAAIGGSLASLLFVHIPIGAGASGAVFGLSGAFVAFGLRYRKQLSQYQRRECRLLLICIGVDIFVAPFVMSDINTVAHVSGLISGGVVGLLLPPAHYRGDDRERKTVIAFASALVGLTVLSGGIAVSNFFLNSAEAVEERIATASPPRDAADLPSYIERYEKLLRQRGYVPEYYYNLALLYMRMMENEPMHPFWGRKLKKLYGRALLVVPQQPEWHKGLFSLYRKTAFKQPDEQEQIKSYIDLYDKVIRRRGYHRILYQNQEYFYSRAKELEPKHKSPWERRLEQLYKKAVSAAPNHATWQNNLAWLYVEQKRNTQKAVKLAQQAVKLEPQNLVFLDTLGWAYVRHGQYRKALRVFELVLGTPEERLFGIPLKFQTDLDNHQFSEDLRTAFENYGLILPPNAKIEIDTEDEKWMITIINGENEVTLVVKREKNRLNVYTLESETILKAQESSWDGMTELLQSDINADIDSGASEEFSRAFFRFYNRMSRQLVAGSAAQAQLKGLFNLFQSNHARPLKE
jgi:rhomboid protease GluP